MQERVAALEAEVAELKAGIAEFMSAVVASNEAFEEYVKANEKRIDELKKR
jgi:hypothetical protein